MTRSEGPVCAHASVKYTEVPFPGSDKFPTKEVVCGVQAAASEGGPTRDTAMGVASRDSEGMYRVEYYAHRVIWVPAGADSLKKRLSVCVHPEGNGHCGFDATIAWLERHCVWDRGKTLPHLAITLWWLEYLRRASTASACALRPGRGVLPTTTKITCTQCSTWSQPNCATSTRRGCGLRR